MPYCFICGEQTLSSYNYNPKGVTICITCAEMDELEDNWENTYEEFEQLNKVTLDSKRFFKIMQIVLQKRKSS